MERVYKTMTTAGSGSIAVGITVLVTGITAGVLLIVSGAILLKNRHEITF